jgi:hypothetical protein
MSNSVDFNGFDKPSKMTWLRFVSYDRMGGLLLAFGSGEATEKKQRASFKSSRLLDRRCARA